MGIYLIEAGFIHLVCWLLYWLLLKRENHFQIQRVYLMGTLLLTLFLPLVSLSFPSSTEGVMDRVGPFLYLDELVVVGKAGPFTHHGGDTWAASWLIPAILIGGSLFFAVLTLRSITDIIRLYKGAQRVNDKGTTLLVHPEVGGSFSFFSWIFVSVPEPAIIAHERAHCHYGHSLDILLTNCFRIFFWWLPTTWLVWKELKLVHEFQADAKVVSESANAEDYRKLLIHASLGSLGRWNLASSFYEGALVKRLKAMKSIPVKISRWKMSLLGLLIGSFSLVIACNNNELDELVDRSTMSSGASLSAQEMMARLERENPDASFHIINVMSKEGEDVEDLKARIHKMGIDQNLVEAYVHNEVQDFHEVIVREGKEFDMAADVSKTPDDIFTIVEEAPDYPGGMAAFFRFVMEEIQYPTSAREQGFEGRVYVQFVVEKDGGVGGVEVVKGDHASLNKEAVRIMNSLPEKFIPGKMRGEAVRVRMVLPIIFKLD